MSGPNPISGAALTRAVGGFVAIGLFMVMLMGAGIFALTGYVLGWIRP